MKLSYGVSWVTQESTDVHDWVDKAIAKRVKAELSPELWEQPALARIVSISNHCYELGTKRFAEYGLTPVSHDVLVNLRLQGEPFQLSPKELAEASFMTSGGMSNALERLERDGLIERLRHPKDRRGVLVTLTRKGKDLIDEVMPRVASFHRGLFEVLDRNETEVLEGLLKRLLVALESQ